MPGIMPVAARTAALKDLRKVAVRVQDEIRVGSLKHENLAPSYPRLRHAWRRFPETWADQDLPSINEILAAVAKVDAVESFEGRERFSKQNRWLKNQTDFLGG